MIYKLTRTVMMQSAIAPLQAQKWRGCCGIKLCRDTRVPLHRSKFDIRSSNPLNCSILTRSGPFLSGLISHSYFTSRRQIGFPTSRPAHTAAQIYLNLVELYKQHSTTDSHNGYRFSPKDHARCRPERRGRCGSPRVQDRSPAPTVEGRRGVN